MQATNPKAPPCEYGFTLVELAIVLVIIGLLVGGILSGQALIRSAELRAVTTEKEQFGVAIGTFIQKYNALPGDMQNATDYWGKLAAYCNADPGTASATGVCNGDGDGKLTDLTSATTGNLPYERFMLWNHLAHAGLISGQYTGIAGAARDMDSTLGVNTPASKMPDGGWSVFTRHWKDTPDATEVVFWEDNYDNAMLLGTQNPGFWPVMPIVTTSEMWALDTKIDDGKPATGNVIGIWWQNKCSSADSGAASKTNFASSYLLSNTGLQCAMMFRNFF